MTICRLKDSVGYTLGHNYNAFTLPLFTRTPGGNDALGVNITHYLPGGGADIGMQPIEAVFCVIDGEMTVTTEEGDVILYKGDAMHFSKGDNKGLKNHTNYPATMLIVAVLGDLP